MNFSSLARELPAAAVRAASPGLVVYTKRQLYHEVCRGLRPPAAGDSRLDPVAPETGLEAFEEAFAAFLARAGRPAGLLSEAPRSSMPLKGREPDLTHYGVSRVLLCQDAEIARMLRANGFPMETGCAVLAHPRPASLPAPLDGMVARARRASVFALHDASAAGLRWAKEVSPRRLWPRGTRFRAVGLRPAHALRLQLAARRDPAPDLAGLPPTLAPVERAWLAEGWSAEVAAVPPLRLLRALRRLVLGAIPAPAPELAQSHAGYMTWP